MFLGRAGPKRPEVRALEPQGATLRGSNCCYSPHGRGHWKLDTCTIFTVNVAVVQGADNPTAKSRDQGLVRVANLAFCTYVDTILIDLELEELEGQSVEHQFFHVP